MPMYEWLLALAFAALGIWTARKATKGVPKETFLQLPADKKRWIRISIACFTLAVAAILVTNTNVHIVIAIAVALVVALFIELWVCAFSLS